MFRTRDRQNDEERGQGEMMPPRGSSRPQHQQIDMDNRTDTGQSPEEPQDFDEDSNDLWSLYGKEAKSHDEAWMETLKDDMDGVLIFAGLFSAVLAALVVLKIADLKVNPAEQSAYYQNQTVQMLDRISQQFASVGLRNSSDYSPPLPYPTFHISASDRRVNIFWLISLVCSLSAALLATLVQQWVRAYMRVFHQSSNPLKTARIRQFLFEGAKRLPTVAEFVPGLIHISLVLFFCGLGDLIFQIDTAVFITTLVPILVCACLYIYCVVESIRNPQSPYRTPFSSIIWFLIQSLRHKSQYSRSPDDGPKSTSMELRQEHYAMKDDQSRKDRDVRAFQWLVHNINGSNEAHNFVLAMPGSFKQEWGINVWKGVVGVVEDRSTSHSNFQVQPHPGPLLAPARERPTVYELCRCVRNFFYAYNNEGDFMETEERRKRLRGCVETAASLVCCTGIKLGLFGEVGETLSEVGDKEKTNDPSKIRSSPSFAVRLTCLSLVAIRKMVYGNRRRLREVAKISLDGIAHLQTDYGYSQDTMALMAVAQRVDDYLTMAWGPVVDLHQAIESWSPNGTESDIKQVLGIHIDSIMELERIAFEAGGVEEVDWHFSFLLETVDETTHKLMQRLPGVFFNKPKPGRPIMISEVFDFLPVGSTPVPPQLIPPGRQIQSLCTLGRKLRDIIEGKNTNSKDETLKSLESLRKIPAPLRGLNYLMKRQLWRLLDLRDGDGLGFTIELFFLAIRQLELSTSLPLEWKKVFYTGTFEAMTSGWENSKDSVGTQRVLLDLLCDLVIGSRGAFSPSDSTDFSYPPYIVEMLLDLVGKMIEGHRDFRQHIDDIVQELVNVNSRNIMDNELLEKVLNVIDTPDTTPPNSST